MTTEAIQHFTAKTSKSIDELEVLWTKAKVESKKKYPDKDERFFPNTMRIMNRLVGVASISVIEVMDNESVASRKVYSPKVRLLDTQTIRDTMIKGGAIGRVDMNVMEYLLLTVSNLSQFLDTPDVMSVTELNMLVRTNRIRTGPTLVIDVNTGVVVDSQGKTRALSLYKEEGPFATISVFIMLWDSEDNSIVTRITNGDTSLNVTENDVPPVLTSKYSSDYKWSVTRDRFKYVDAAPVVDVEESLSEVEGGDLSIEELSALKTANIPHRYAFNVKGGFIDKNSSKYHENSSYKSFVTASNRLLPGNVKLSVWQYDPINAVIDKGYVKIDYHQNRDGKNISYKDGIYRELEITGTAKSLDHTGTLYKQVIAIVSDVAKEFDGDIIIKFVVKGFETLEGSDTRLLKYSKTASVLGSKFAHTILKRLIIKANSVKLQDGTGDPVTDEEETQELSSIGDDGIDLEPSGFVPDVEKQDGNRATTTVDYSGWVIPYCTSTGRVFVAKRDNVSDYIDAWGFIGGSSSQDESSFLTTIRESFEELNIVLEVDSLHPFSNFVSNSTDTGNSVEHHVHSYVYFTDKEVPVHLNSENSFGVWIEPELLQSLYSMHPAVKYNIGKLINLGKALKKTGKTVFVDNLGVPEGIAEANRVHIERYGIPIRFDITFNENEYASSNVYLYAGPVDNTGKQTLIAQVKVSNGLEAMHSLVVKRGYHFGSIGLLIVHITEGLINPPMRVAIDPKSDLDQAISLYQYFGYRIAEDDDLTMVRTSIGNGYGDAREYPNY